MQSRWHLTHLKRLTANRSFQFIFWAVLLVLFLSISVFLLAQQPLIHNLELTLLDRKIRFRCEHFEWESTTPSDAIVILGIDGLTDKYIRMHPEAGLDMTLPRAELARVLNYLTEQGAKTVIFDLEFKDPKPGDDQLASAIQRHGHVYAAARMDYKLENFVEDQWQATAIERTKNPRQFYEQLLLGGFFYPALFQQVEKKTFLPLATVSPLDIGIGPFFNVSPELIPALNAWGKKLNEQIFYMAYGDRLTSSNAIESRMAYQNLEQRAYAPLCLQTSYRHYYQNNPEFLHELEKKGVR
jgi:CHASE2 domain